MNGCANEVTRFDPIASSVIYSQLTGVLAGVLFTGMVLLVTIKPARAAEEARRTSLEYLVPSFFAAVVATFFYGVIAGEGSCPRANIESLSTSGLIAIVALGSFISLAWLLTSVEAHAGLADVTAACIAFVGLLVVAQVAITIADTQTRFHQEGTMASILTGAYLLGGLGMVTATSLLWRKAPQRLRNPIHQRVRRAGKWLILVVMFANILVFNLAANSRSDTLDYDKDHSLVLTAEIVVMVTTLASVLVLLSSAPPRRPASRAPRRPPRRPTRGAGRTRRRSKMPLRTGRSPRPEALFAQPTPNLPLQDPV